MRTRPNDFNGIEADGAALLLATSYSHLYQSERAHNVAGAKFRRYGLLALAALLIIGPPLFWLLGRTTFDLDYLQGFSLFFCGFGTVAVMGLGVWAFVRSRKVRPAEIAPPQPMQIARVYWPFTVLTGPPANADGDGNGVYVWSQPDRAAELSALVNVDKIESTLHAQPAEDEVTLLNQIGDLADLLLLVNEQKMPGFVPQADVLGRTLARLAVDSVTVDPADLGGVVLAAGEAEQAQARAFLAHLHHAVDVLEHAGKDGAQLDHFRQRFHTALDVHFAALDEARQALDRWIAGNLGALRSMPSEDGDVTQLQALFAPSIARATEEAQDKVRALSPLADLKSEIQEEQTTRAMTVQAGFDIKRTFHEQQLARDLDAMNTLAAEKNEITELINTVSAQMTALAAQQDLLAQDLAHVEQDLAAAATPPPATASSGMGPKLAQPAALAKRVGLQKRKESITAAQQQVQAQWQELQQQLTDHEAKGNELENKLETQKAVLEQTEQLLRDLEVEMTARKDSMQAEAAQKFAELEQTRQQQEAQIWQAQQTLTQEKNALIALSARASAHLPSWSIAVNQALEPVFAQRRQALEQARQLVDRLVDHLQRHGAQGIDQFAAYRWSGHEIEAGEVYLVPFWLYRLPNAPWTLLGVPGDCTVVPRQDTDDLGYVLKDDPVLKLFLAQQMDRRSQSAAVDEYAPVSPSLLRAHIDSLAARGYITPNLHAYILSGLGK